MPSEHQGLPLGYHAAHHAADVGYAAIFEGCTKLIPKASDLASTEDNRTPQFGFVGPRYAETRVLVLGVNPGVVKRGTVKDRDQRSLAALRRFRDEPSPSNFLAAQDANRVALEGWRDDNPHWKHLLARTSLTFDDIAFSNALPYRTHANKTSARLRLNAASHYAWRLVAELEPRLVICFGNTAAAILTHSGRLRRRLIEKSPTLLPLHVTWPRDQRAKFGPGSKWEPILDWINRELPPRRAA